MTEQIGPPINQFGAPHHGNFYGPLPLLPYGGNMYGAPPPVQFGGNFYGLFHHNSSSMLLSSTQFSLTLTISDFLTEGQTKKCIKY